MKLDTSKQKKSRYWFWRLLRRVSQISFFLIFVFLFIKTDYTGSDTLEYAVNILFRIDPLLAMTTMLAARTFIALMVPAICVLVLSFFVGRHFCGWLCPMGAVLDGVRTLTRSRTQQKDTLFPYLPRLLFLFVIVTSVFGLSLTGFVDPFSLLVRGMVQVVYPVTYYLSDICINFSYHNLPPLVNNIAELFYDFLHSTVLPFEQRYYELVLVSGILLFSLLGLEFTQSRFFCRNVCPLGAMFGLVSNSGVLKLSGGDDRCGSCRLCAKRCRMGAIDDTRYISSSTCILCMDCLVECPKQIIHPKLLVPLAKRGKPQKTSLSRRQFLGTISAGMVLPLVYNVGDTISQEQNMLVRPPGALIERDFLAHCVRCGECLQVCLTNGLQPATFQAGLAGLFTPYLQARRGYCEFNCTLCGQVCPTGAIQVLDKAKKHTTKIGHAWFDKNRCLPFAKGIPCIVCEEHCPTPDKAIKFKIVEVKNQQGSMVSLKQPFIVDELCVGCGICETKCPLPGRSAIFVNNAGEDRDPENRLPGAASTISVGY